MKSKLPSQVAPEPLIQPGASGPIINPDTPHMHTASKAAPVSAPSSRKIPIARALRKNQFVIFGIINVLVLESIILAASALYLYFAVILLLTIDLFWLESYKNSKSPYTPHRPSVAAHSLLSATAASVIFGFAVIYIDSHGETDAGFMLILVPLIWAGCLVWGLALGYLESFLSTHINHRLAKTSNSGILFTIYFPTILIMIWALLSVMVSKP